MSQARYRSAFALALVAMLLLAPLESQRHASGHRKDARSDRLAHMAVQTAHSIALRSDEAGRKLKAGKTNVSFGASPALLDQRSANTIGELLDQRSDLNTTTAAGPRAPPSLRG